MSSEVQASDGDPAPCIVTFATSEEAFAALRNDWDDLHGRVPGAGGSQTFLYAWQGWARLNGKPASLRIVVARVGPKLVAIWPLCVVWETGARVARHLGCGDGAEYASPLIASHSQQLIGLAEALLSAAERACDVLEVHNLDAGSSLGLAIVTRGRTMYRGAPASPIILLSGWANFDAWMGTRSKSFRTGLRYDRRRISAQGELIFREIGQAGAGSFIDWLMAKKGRWLDDRRIKRNWLRESRTSDFYTALIGLPRSGVVAFVLELGGKAIAGCICLRSSATLEFYITAFDPKLSAFSPGNLLIEDVATWCIARGLDFDFRLTHDPYKLRWSGVFREYEVFILGVTPVGALKVAQISFREWRRRARRRVKRLARDGLPPQLLSLLKRRRRA